MDSKDMFLIKKTSRNVYAYPVVKHEVKQENTSSYYTKFRHTVTYRKGKKNELVTETYTSQSDKLWLLCTYEEIMKEYEQKIESLKYKIEHAFSVLDKFKLVIDNEVNEVGRDIKRTALNNLKDKIWDAGQ